MATAAVAGRKGFLGWSTGSSSTGITTKAGALQNWTINQNRPTIDATSFDSSGYEENITGVLGATVSATLYSYSSDAQQKASRKQLVAANPPKFQLKLYPNSTAVTFKYTAAANIESISLKGGTRDVVMYDVTFKVTGAIAYSS